MDILRRAYDREHDSRDRRPPTARCWEYYTVGASRADIARLLDEGLVIVYTRIQRLTKYHLSDKGRSLVFATTMEQEFARIPADNILEAMELVVGWDDLKHAIANSIERRRRINYLLEGPPACGKSLFIEAIRSAVPDAYIAFGSRTSASGLSDALFEHQPGVLLLDEADKMHHDCYSVMLGLMESGEILETKSNKTRGIRLEHTMTIAACNSSEKMPREFLSRFALHVKFPHYTRDEFIDVCIGFLSRAESCPPDIARLLGEMVFDCELGDVRKARGAWQLMDEATEAEARRVIQLMVKYSAEQPPARKRQKEAASRLPGL